MKIRVCPNSPDHKTFHITAHVTEEWLVDERGEFLEVSGDGGETVHGPDHDDIWTCSECGCAETKEGDET